ncbi:MAG: AAA family ATPase [Epsilonproteobacteria bacterium]|nr:AAA family ATPase [Campylobacterota bacterium]
MPNSKINRILLVVSAVLIILLVLFALFRDTSENITLEDAQEMLKNHEVDEVVATQKYVFLRQGDKLYKIPFALTTPSMFEDYKVKIDTSGSILWYILIAVLIVGSGSIIFRWFQKHPIEDSSTKLKSGTNNDPLELEIEPIKAIQSDVSFDDIGGIEDVKVELQEIIDFLQNPTKYKNFGARLPRGVLLVGPPGVGKTMIAKAVAKEAGVSFYYQSGASFVQIYVGMGAKRVHELFNAAKKNAPAIIFIDEIDAVGKKRDGSRNDEREATLNQLLTEMDGFESQNGIIVIAATNKIDVLDSALLRAGRFDRRVFVDLPTKKERYAILEKYLQKIPNSVDIEKIASITVGFNGATLAAFVNEAALLAIRQNHFEVTMEHFYEVKDKVMFGKKKLVVLNEKQKQHRVTYQSAKVLVATYYDLPFEKLLLSNERLTPPNQETSMLQSEIEAHIKMFLAGVVMCDIKYNEHTSNAKQDLEDAKELTRKMILEYGMGKDIITSEEEVQKTINTLYKQTQDLLLSLEERLFVIEEILLKKEAITKEEVREILSAVS